MLMIIKDIIARENGVLTISSTDGRDGDFDIKPYLEYEAFIKLSDFKEFERVRNGGYFIEWECGADLSADTIEAKWLING